MIEELVQDASARTGLSTDQARLGLSAALALPAILVTAIALGARAVAPAAGSADHAGARGADKPIVA